MQQHPVPQNVTQYQFRLVGDMTLKQFLELAGGMVVAYLFFASNLLFFIKWPLALLSLLLGIGLAFFPIEERPLDVWIINFLKSIYAPTRFIWKKTTRLPALFTFKPHDVIEKKTSTKTVKAPTIAASTAPTTDYSEEESKKIKNLEAILAKLEPTTAKVPSTAQIKPSPKPKISVRKLSPGSVIFQSGSDSNKATATPNPTRPPEQKSIKIPDNKPLTLVEEKREPASINPPSQTIFTSKPSVAQKPSEAAQAAESIKLPASPQKPNIVVGMVVDSKGALINNAIIEIITKDGTPARAIKTNSLGQFYISTPLAPGNYIIEVDAGGLNFPNQSLKVEDKLISPIILRATQ